MAKNLAVDGSHAPSMPRRKRVGRRGKLAAGGGRHTSMIDAGTEAFCGEVPDPGASPNAPTPDRLLAPNVLGERLGEKSHRRVMHRSCG